MLTRVPVPIGFLCFGDLFSVASNYLLPACVRVCVCVSLLLHVYLLSWPCLNFFLVHVLILFYFSVSLLVYEVLRCSLGSPPEPYLLLQLSLEQCGKDFCNSLSQIRRNLGSHFHMYVLIFLFMFFVSSS